MRKLLVLFLVPSFVAIIAGCGGSGSSNNGRRVIDIQNTRFVPKSITIQTGSTVQWTNVDTNPHRVVSGALLPTSNPQIRPTISIRPDNTFAPPLTQANFGDTIVWRNDRSTSFAMDIVDDGGNIIATLSFLIGQTIQYSQFPTAGQYTFQQSGFPLFSGRVVLYGVPQPDGLFDSGTLGTGGTFSPTFVSTGVFDYYDLNESDPTRSFATGVVIVQ